MTCLNSCPTCTPLVGMSCFLFLAYKKNQEMPTQPAHPIMTVTWASRFQVPRQLGILAVAEVWKLNRCLDVLSENCGMFFLMKFH